MRIAGVGTQNLLIGATYVGFNSVSIYWLGLTCKLMTAVDSASFEKQMEMTQQVLLKPTRAQTFLIGEYQLSCSVIIVDIQQVISVTWHYRAIKSVANWRGCITQRKH